MKYKIIIASCILVMVSGLSYMAATSQAKTTEEDLTEDKTALEENSEKWIGSENIIGDFFAGGGLPAFRKHQELKNMEDDISPEVIAPLNETALQAEAKITDIELDAQEENEYADLAIANVTNYVNVRTEPNTASAVVGKIYDGAVAQILSVVEGEDGSWFQVVSGNVDGYIKSEFFLYGDEAVAVIDDYVTRYATVLADRLNVRSQPDIEASRVGYINHGERVLLLENQGEWLKVQYAGNDTGFVAAEYVTVSEEFVYAKTLEEEAQELAALRAQKERQKQSETQTAENTAITVTPPENTYSTNEELRQEIIDYAMQFLGNKYIHGGKTLAGGTDCSGFTSLIYADFGYSLGRTPESQLANAGRGINYSEAQPGDIICYGSKGKCTHVALYIGGGQIIHSANSRKGVIIGQADYDTILGVRNVID